MSLASEMNQLFAGADRVATHGRSFHENLEILVEQTGSGRAAGRLLGVPETTIRRWRTGVTPRRVLDLVPFARVAASARKGAFGKVYRGEATIAIKAVIVYSSDRRERWIHIGREISRQKMQGIMRAWAGGDDERATRLMRNAIYRDYFHIEPPRAGEVDEDDQPAVTLGAITDMRIE